MSQKHFCSSSQNAGQHEVHGALPLAFDQHQASLTIETGRHGSASGNGNMGGRLMELVESEPCTDAPPEPSTRTGGWRVAAAQKRGTSHETTGEVCQDAYGMAMLSAETLVIAIADGAGSARYAEEGAGLA